MTNPFAKAGIRDRGRLDRLLDAIRYDSPLVPPWWIATATHPNLLAWPRQSHLALNCAFKRARRSGYRGPPGHPLEAGADPHLPESVT